MSTWVFLVKIENGLVRIVLASLQTASTDAFESAQPAFAPTKSLKLSLYPARNELDEQNTWNGVTSWEDNVYVQALNDDLKWGGDDPDLIDKTVLSYYIYDDEPFFDEDIQLTAQPVKPEELQAMITAMDSYQNVSGLEFVATDNPDEANIKWAMLNDDESESWLGWSYGPWSGGSLSTVNSDYYDLSEGDSVEPGSYYYLTYIHELGHTLGFGHPHDGDTVFPGVAGDYESGDNLLNSSPWTTLTYVDSSAENDLSPGWESESGYLEAPGTFDIAIAQYLYGPNENHNSDDTTYVLDGDLNGYKTIWDAGGQDIIDASEAPYGVTIDLRSATLENEIGGGGYVSGVEGYYSGYIIPYNSTGNAVIEHASGSIGDDIIQGNEYGNLIYGNDGNDTISAGESSDSIAGGKGDDVLEGGDGPDVFSFSEGYDLVKDFSPDEDSIFIDTSIFDPYVSLGEGSQSDL